MDALRQTTIIPLFPFLCCHATDVINCSLSHHVMLRRTNRTKHIPAAMQICVCQLFSVHRNATSKFPIRNLEAWGWLKGVWDKHASDTPWTYRSLLPGSYSNYESTSCCAHFFFFPKKKKKKPSCGCWCHKVKCKHITINPALMFGVRAIFMTGQFLAKYV